MRKAFRHTGVLMMLAVVALGLIGAAYTLWYDKLTMEATISTGTLDADWSIHPLSQTSAGLPVVAVPTNVGLNGGVASYMSDNLNGGKTTAHSWGLFTNANFHTPAGVDKPQPQCDGAVDTANDTLTLTMSGLFPYAGCDYEIDLHSTGSVPYHIAIKDSTVEQWFSVPSESGGGHWGVPVQTANMPWSRGFPSHNGDGSYTGTDAEAQCFSFFNADWKGPIPGQINLGNVSTGAPIQIHPGADLNCKIRFVLDENWWNGDRTGLGSADPDHNISNQGLQFRITTHYTAYQWNETPAVIP